MGFKSFNNIYLKNRLAFYESFNTTPPHEVIQEAKIILKMFEDILDEGYTDVWCYFSKEFNAFNRLRNFILSNNEQPFKNNNLINNNASYSNKTYYLEDYLKKLDVKMLLYENALNENFFTEAFEKIRLFETIKCQDSLFRLNSINNENKFLVNETKDKETIHNALLELCTWNKLIK